MYITLVSFSPSHVPNDEIVYFVLSYFVFFVSASPKVNRRRLNREPSAGVLLELECPIRAVSRVPVAKGGEGEGELVLAVGTNQKALLLGKVSRDRCLFEALHEWPNSHVGSVYCLDVLGKLGRGKNECII